MDEGDAALRLHRPAPLAGLMPRASGWAHWSGVMCWGTAGRSAAGVLGSGSARDCAGGGGDGEAGGRAAGESGWLLRADWNIKGTCGKGDLFRGRDGGHGAKRRVPRRIASQCSNQRGSKT